MEKKLQLSVKGVIRFFILYLLTVGMWWFFRSYVLLLVLVLIPCCVGLFGVLLWTARDKVWAEAVLPGGKVGKDTEFSFDIRLHNQSRITGFTVDLTYIYKNVFTGHSDCRKLHLWSAPIEGCEVKQLLKSRYSGRVEAEIAKLIVYDPLHVFFLTGCRVNSSSVLVWPKFTEETEEEIYSCVEGFPKDNESKKHGAEYNPDYEIREYIPGDELKSIHWKLTAKQDRLMVKERLATGREKVNVLLPLSKSREENDGLLEALYGLGRILLKKEYPMQLYWPDRGGLQGCFIVEQGELENAISRILSGEAAEGNAKELMDMEHPGEKYILIQTGVYKGAYIQ